MTEYEEIVKVLPRSYNGYTSYLYKGMNGWSEYHDRYSLATMDIVKKLAPDQIDKEMVDIRGAAISHFGFAILTEKVIMEIKRLTDRPLVELGAGGGYWSWELARNGVLAIPTDIVPVAENHYFEKEWMDIEVLDAVAAVKRYPNHIPLLVWPNDYNAEEGWSDETLDACTSNLFIYCGEGWGGCTGSHKFHHILSEQWELLWTIKIPQWDGIHDIVEIYLRGASDEQDTKGGD